MQPTGVDPDLQLSVEGPQLDEEAAPDFIDRLTLLAERKFFIFKFVGAVAVLSVIAAFVWPKTYEGVVKIMPPQQNPSAATNVLNQLGPLAALAGSTLGIHNPSDLYVDMLRSRSVADALIQRFSLMQVYGLKDIADVRKLLEERSQIEAAGKDGVITITVRDRDPQRAADMANAYVEELKKLSQILAVTEAGRRRLFFEQQVQLAGNDLAKAEVAMKETQQKTGLIHLDSQAKAMIESLTYLQAQLTAKEAEVEAMRSFATSENPDLIRARQEVEALRSQLAKVQSGQSATTLADVATRNLPEAGLEYVRSMRDLRYHESLWEALTKQYEIARIDEAKDASIIQFLDRAVRPTKKASPRRAVVVVVATFSGLLVAVMIVLLGDWAKADPERDARLQRLKLALRLRRKS